MAPLTTHNPLIATPLPWFFEAHSGYGGNDPDGDPWPFGYISWSWGDVGRPIFELSPVLYVDPPTLNICVEAIIARVNAHDDLVAALRGLLSFVQKQDCAIDTDFAEAALAKAGAS